MEYKKWAGKKSMRKITLFYDGSWYTFKWFKVMLWAKEELKELGYEVSFLNEEEYAKSRDKLESFEKNALNYEYDIVMIAHHSSHIGFCSIGHEKFAELMEKLRERCNKIIWCDTSDSTGTLWAQAFPFVDLYFKKQVLSDLSLYRKEMWGGRIYTQYFYDHGYVGEMERDRFPAITEEDVNKIRVSWNVGLGELFEEKEVSYQKPYAIFTPQMISPCRERKYDIQYKGSLDYSLCGYQRLRSTEIIDGSKWKHSGVFEKVPYEDYIQEVAQSKTVISPYGWGEVCTRDFEAFLYGAALIKPDMSHLITYPDWYIENQTYVPVKWNLDDFVETTEGILASKQYMKIAQNAQELFLYHRNDKMGKVKFAEHIVEQLGEEA